MKIVPNSQKTPTGQQPRARGQRMRVQTLGAGMHSYLHCVCPALSLSSRDCCRLDAAASATYSQLVLINPLWILQLGRASTIDVCMLVALCFELKNMCCNNSKLLVQHIAHAGSRTRVTSMGGLYDAATLRALMVSILDCKYWVTKSNCSPMAF